MKKLGLLLPLLCLTGLVGCGTREVSRTKTYDTGWVEVNSRKGYLTIYVNEAVSSYDFDRGYENFKYRYCSYDNFAEMTVKYTSIEERTDYFYGANLTYHLYQYN
jgi:hypothetical protein